MIKFYCTFLAKSSGERMVLVVHGVIMNLSPVSSVPMQNVAKPTRGRSMSMQDYDIPLRQRINTTQMTCSPVIDASPSSVDGDSAASGGAGGGSAGSSAALPSTTTCTEQLVAN